MPLLLVELDGTVTEPLLVPYIILNTAQRASFVIDWSLLELDTHSSKRNPYFELNCGS